MRDARLMEAQSQARSFDGVICFAGGDWWYHNRGHYDMQMMRELSRSVPVLFVNSIGLRIPRPAEGMMFAKRMTRKVRSLVRGLVRVRDRFGVYSPFVVPGRRGMTLSKHILAPQARWAARRMGISRPLVWVTCPPAVEAISGLNPVAVVYQRTDRWESYPDADPDLVRRYHLHLQELADVTIYCSTMLFDEEKPAARNPVFIDHGVDFERFARAGRSRGRGAPEVAHLTRPLIGFVGAIDASTFDPHLFREIATQMADATFVLVGACSLDPGFLDLPNVVLLGQRPYDVVPDYMGACDVLIMPWNNSDWIRACNPIKLKEYLAVGRPVVSTDFFELRNYQGYVAVAAEAPQFVRRIREFLDAPPDPEWLRARVAMETWTAKAERVIQELSQRGIQPVHTLPRPALEPQ